MGSDVSGYGVIQLPEALFGPVRAFNRGELASISVEDVPAGPGRCKIHPHWWRCGRGSL